MYKRQADGSPSQCKKNSDYRWRGWGCGERTHKIPEMCIRDRTLTPISNLKIYGEILSETNHENQEEIATILEQTEKLDLSLIHI